MKFHSTLYASKNDRAIYYLGVNAAEPSGHTSAQLVSSTALLTAS